MRCRVAVSALPAQRLIPEPGMKILYNDPTKGPGKWIAANRNDQHNYQP